MSVVISELPGTPAPANAAAVDASTIVNWRLGPSGRPYMEARNTAVTALYAAAPFLLIVAPAGSTKLDASVGTPIRVAEAMLTGSTALDDAVAKANINASEVRLKKSRMR